MGNCTGASVLGCYVLDFNLEWMGREPVKCQRSRIYLELTFTLDAFKLSCKVLFNFEEKSPTGFCRRENSGYLSSIDRMEEVPLPSSDWWRYFSGYHISEGLQQSTLFEKNLEFESPHLPVVWFWANYLNSLFQFSHL